MRLWVQESVFKKQVPALRWQGHLGLTKHLGQCVGLAYGGYENQVEPDFVCFLKL